MPFAKGAATAWFIHPGFVQAERGHAVAARSSVEGQFDCSHGLSNPRALAPTCAVSAGLFISTVRFAVLARWFCSRRRYASLNRRSWLWLQGEKTEIDGCAVAVYFIEIRYGPPLQMPAVAKALRARGSKSAISELYRSTSKFGPSYCILRAHNSTLSTATIAQSPSSAHCCHYRSNG